jgi:hypothetical protein
MLRPMSVPSWETLRTELEVSSEADTNLQLAGSEEDEEEEVLLYPESPVECPAPDITAKQELPVGSPETLDASTWRRGSVQQCTQQLRDALVHIFGLFMRPI